METQWNRSHIFHEGDNDGGRDFKFRLMSNDNSGFGTKNDYNIHPDWLLVSDAHIPLESWIHVVGIADSNNNLKQIWINGSLVSEDTSWLGPANVGYHFKLQIGRALLYGDSVTHFQGKIDDLYFFNRALSEAEILALYSQ